MQVARLVDQLGEALERRRRPGFRPEPGDRLVLVDGVGRQQLRPGPLLGPVLAQAQLAAVLEPDQDPRGAVFERGPLVVVAQPAGRHQVDQQRQVAELDDGQLADPPHPGQLAARQRLERRVEGLHHVHPRRQRRLDPGAGERRVQAPHGDLDLGKLGHAPILAVRRAGRAYRLNQVHSTGSRCRSAPGQRTSETRKAPMQELPTIQPTHAPDLSPEEIGAISGRGARRWPPSATR